MLIHHMVISRGTLPGTKPIQLEWNGYQKGRWSCGDVDEALQFISHAVMLDGREGVQMVNDENSPIPEEDFKRLKDLEKFDTILGPTGT